jgi:hypothetical protein
MRTGHSEEVAPVFTPTGPPAGNGYDEVSHEGPPYP